MAPDEHAEREELFAEVRKMWRRRDPAPTELGERMSAAVAEFDTDVSPEAEQPLHQRKTHDGGALGNSPQRRSEA